MLSVKCQLVSSSCRQGDDKPSSGHHSFCWTFGKAPRAETELEMDPERLPRPDFVSLMKSIYSLNLLFNRDL